ncbi:MAG: 30S ribosomal protein S12 methylthiotransferase RimO [Dermatophilaceae bacterium]
MTEPASRRRVALVTLGCARNEVDSELMAARLVADGWDLVEDAARADVAVVNTCGFIEAAKKDSIDALLEAADLKEHGRTRAVVAVGCLAERYGQRLAAELPEADAVLGFDSYAALSSHLGTVLAGGQVPSHVPSDRRRLLPLSPAQRPEALEGPAAEASPAGSAAYRVRLDRRPWAPLKIASGCDRRCAFCAIPSFRGAFVSRRPADVLAEARWLAGEGVREVLLVSENSTSYGKDLGDLALLETLLPALTAVEGLAWVRVSYLQPAEIRPGLLEAMAGTPGVAPYFDISFQHASGPVLRRMRRFGDAEAFLGLVGRVRDLVPTAGIRSNVIVGFPGETDEDVEVLEGFLAAAGLDAVGVFGYSDEEGTEANGLPGQIAPDLVAERVGRLTDLAEQLTAQRAQERIGEPVDVLVEHLDSAQGVVLGRAGQQGPDVDGETQLHLSDLVGVRVGDVVAATVVDSEGVDLRAVPR